MKRVLQKERKEYIDAARGVGIVLLVLGHIVTGNSYLFNWIFSFHMPLFFFLSGMCVKQSDRANVGLYIKKKLGTRMLPYFVITGAGFVICMLIPEYREPVLEDGVRVQLQHIFLRMSPINLYIGQVWFLASLFWAEVYFYVWYRGVGSRNIFVQVATACVFVVIACNLWRIQGMFIGTGRIYFHMDSACMGAFCYILGFLTERYGVAAWLKEKSWLWVFPVVICSIYFGTYKNGYVNMCDLIYGNVFFYLIAMCSGILAVLIVALHLKKGKLLAWYGRYSLPLFASHTFLIYLVREWMYWITGEHYTMMGNVPDGMAFLMTAIVLLLFVPVGIIYRKVFQK